MKNELENAGKTMEIRDIDVKFILRLCVGIPLVFAFGIGLALAGAFAIFGIYLIIIGQSSILLNATIEILSYKVPLVYLALYGLCCWLIAFIIFYPDLKKYIQKRLYFKEA